MNIWHDYYCRSLSSNTLSELFLSLCSERACRHTLAYSSCKQSSFSPPRFYFCSTWPERAAGSVNHGVHLLICFVESGLVLLDKCCLVGKDIVARQLRRSTGIVPGTCVVCIQTYTFTGWHTWIISISLTCKARVSSSDAFTGLPDPPGCCQVSKNVSSFDFYTWGVNPVSVREPVRCWYSAVLAPKP